MAHTLIEFTENDKEKAPLLSQMPFTAASHYGYHMAHFIRETGPSGPMRQDEPLPLPSFFEKEVRFDLTIMGKTIDEIEHAMICKILEYAYETNEVTEARETNNNCNIIAIRFEAGTCYGLYDSSSFNKNALANCRFGFVLDTERNENVAAIVNIDSEIPVDDLCHKMNNLLTTVHSRDNSRDNGKTMLVMHPFRSTSHHVQIQNCIRNFRYNVNIVSSYNS